MATYVTSMTDTPAQTRGPLGPRVRASCWDFLVIIGWLAVLTIAGFVIQPLLPPAPADLSYPPLVADVVAFTATVLPVWAYLTVTESGPTRASWGKRRAGLHVVSANGACPGWRHAAGRNAVKLVPWQLAHIAVARLILGSEQWITIGITYTLSLLIPVVSITMAWRDSAHRALHDHAAGTRVVHSHT